MWSSPMKKKLKYGALIFFSLIITDQIARHYIEKNIWEDRKSYFDAILAKVDFTEVPLDTPYKFCERNLLFLGYTDVTCFQKTRWTYAELRLEEPFMIEMYYHPPRSHFTSLFENWWYYQLTHTTKIIMFVTKEKTVIEDLRYG